MAKGLPGLASLTTIREQHGFRQLTPQSARAPADLAGRLYRIGPGRFEADGRPYPHWFDGEGLVAAIDFQGGDVRVACGLVETVAPAQPDAGRKGRFGIAPDGLWRRLQSIWRADAYLNSANTALFIWGTRLFALYEANPPTEIDPETLAVIGETDLGVIKRAFSAHPKRHGPTGALINQGFRLLPRPTLDYYRLGTDGVASCLASTPYDGSVFTHDFAVTDRHIVSICSPVFADPVDLMVRGRPLSEAMRWRPEKSTEIIVTPIDPTGIAYRLRAPAFFYSHTANAFDEGDDIVIHGIVSGDGSNMGWIHAIRAGVERLPRVAISRLAEIRVNRAAGSVALKALAPTCIDFPTINPAVAGRPYRYVYAAGFRDENSAYSDLFDVIVKIDLKGDVHKVSFGEGCFVSEAIFVARPAALTEDDGYLLTLVYDARRDQSSVAVLDARGVPEILSIHDLGQPMPMSFHGLWRATAA